MDGPPKTSLEELEDQLDAELGAASEEVPLSPEEGDEDTEDVLPPSPPAFSFTHPDLAGRSPAEIEQLYELAQQAVISQSRRLSEMEHSPEPEDDQLDSFVPGFKDAIRREFDAAVKPVVEEVNILREERVFERFRANARYPDFGELEPTIRTLIQQAHGDPTNENVVHVTYLAARGMRGLPGGPPAPAPTAAPPNNTAPVQPVKAPSRAPLAPGRGGKPKLRQLTEEEETIRKAWKMSKEEYLELQEARPEDVLPSKTGGDGND